MRSIRYAAWAAVAVLAIVTAAMYFLGPRIGTAGGTPGLWIGGPFSLTTHEGKRLSSEDLKGKPFAIFFGFTYCPDVCPTTLLEITKLIEALGPDAGKMRYLFVTVDPERDTPEQMKLYVSSFDPHITGLTGTPEEIAEIAKAYRVYYEKVPQDDDYTMNHSTLVYLMDANGNFKDVINYGTDADVRLKKVRELIAAQ